MTHLTRARSHIEAAQTPEFTEPGLTPELLARLEPFKLPAQARERFTVRTRKDVLRALTERISIYPEVAGYVVAVDWRDGGRAAARVQTVRRRKHFPVPAEVLSLFDGTERVTGGGAMGSIAASSSVGRLPTAHKLAAVSLDPG